jgi:hypothetical protein
MMDDDRDLPFLALAAALIVASLCTVAAAFLEAGAWGHAVASVAKGAPRLGLYRPSVPLDDRIRLAARFLGSGIGFWLAGAALLATFVRRDARRLVLWAVLTLAAAAAVLHLLGLVLGASPDVTSSVSGETSERVLNQLAALLLLAGAAWVAAAGLGWWPRPSAAESELE